MILLCTIPMLCAAVSDWKKRIIPDWTWIVILLIGGVSAFCMKTPYMILVNRVAGFLLPGLSLLIIAVRYGGVGGGDIKLMAALGFCLGLYDLAVILFFAVIPACVYARLTKQRSIPLAVFLCIGFFAVLIKRLFIV